MSHFMSKKPVIGGVVTLFIQQIHQVNVLHWHNCLVGGKKITNADCQLKSLESVD